MNDERLQKVFKYVDQFLNKVDVCPEEKRERCISHYLPDALLSMSGVVDITKETALKKEFLERAVQLIQMEGYYDPNPGKQGLVLV